MSVTYGEPLKIRLFCFVRESGTAADRSSDFRRIHVYILVHRRSTELVLRLLWRRPRHSTAMLSYSSLSCIASLLYDTDQVELEHVQLGLLLQ